MQLVVARKASKHRVTRTPEVEIPLASISDAPGVSVLGDRDFRHSSPDCARGGFRRAPPEAQLWAVFYRFFRWASRNGEPRFSRSSIQCCSGMDINTSTTRGSNWLPEQRRISSRAWDM